MTCLKALASHSAPLFSTPSANTYFHSLFYSTELNGGTTPVMTSEQSEDRSYVWTAGSNSPVVSLSGPMAEPPRAEGLLSCDQPVRPRAPEHPQQALTCSTVRGWTKLSKHLQGKRPPLFLTNNGRPRAERWGGWSISHPIRVHRFLTFSRRNAECNNVRSQGFTFFCISNDPTCLFPRDF